MDVLSLQHSLWGNIMNNWCTLVKTVPEKVKFWLRINFTVCYSNEQINVIHRTVHMLYRGNNHIDNNDDNAVIRVATCLWDTYNKIYVITVKYMLLVMKQPVMHQEAVYSDSTTVLQSGIHCLTVCAIQLLDQSSFNGLWKPTCLPVVSVSLTVR